jgi:hypothetical protein
VCPRKHREGAVDRYNAGMRHGNRFLLRWSLTLLLGGVVLPATVSAQQKTTNPSFQSAETMDDAPAPRRPAVAPAAVAAPHAKLPQHAFWDRKNILLFSGVAVFRGLDYASTRNFQARGRTEILLPDDVVNNSAGFAALEAAGAATSIGISYLLHRTGHHKLERWLSIGHIGVTAFGVARNYSLKSKHP